VRVVAGEEQVGAHRERFPPGAVTDARVPRRKRHGCIGRRGDRFDRARLQADRIGVLDDANVLRLNRALVVFLGIASSA